MVPNGNTATHKRVTNNTATDKRATDKPVTDKPVTDKTVTDKTATQQHPLARRGDARGPRGRAFTAPQSRAACFSWRSSHVRRGPGQSPVPFFCARVRS